MHINARFFDANTPFMNPLLTTFAPPGAAFRKNRVMVNNLPHLQNDEKEVGRIFTENPYVFPIVFSDDPLFGNREGHIKFRHFKSNPRF